MHAAHESKGGSLFTVIRFGLRLLLLVAELMFIVVRGAYRLLGVVFGLRHLARYALRRGLYCRRGHAVPLLDVLCRCEACGFTYTGSPLSCPGPGCSAPTAASTTCPTCGESVSSPFRVGHE